MIETYIEFISAFLLITAFFKTVYIAIDQPHKDIMIYLVCDIFVTGILGAIGATLSQTT